MKSLSISSLEVRCCRADGPALASTGDKRRTKSYIRKHYAHFDFEVPFSEHGKSPSSALVRSRNPRALKARLD